MKHHHLLLMLPAAALTLLTGCTDDDYDLSDIDTTTEIKVNDLVVPIQMNAITLDEATDLDKNDNITVYTDGNGNRWYAISKSGDITSSPIHVKAIGTGALTINPLTVSLIGTRAASFSIPDAAQSIAYRVDNVDPAVLSITSVTTDPITFSIKVSVDGMTGGTLNLRNTDFRFPKGLTGVKTPEGMTYDPETGLLHINNLDIDLSKGFELKVEASGINALQAGLTINNRVLDFSSSLGLAKGGTATIDGNVSGIPALRLEFGASALNVTAFTGKINYAMRDVRVAPVDLSGLPDFLSNPTTNILLSQPQINVGINNTVAKYNADASGVLNMESFFRNGSETDQKPSQSAPFTLGNVKGQSLYNLVFAPTSSTPVAFEEYLDSKHVAYDDLGDMLAINPPMGLPYQIGVSLTQLSVTGHVNETGIEGDIENFPVGKDIEGVSGSYRFFAPLAFREGSVVVYEKSDSGWGSSDLNDLNINRLTLNATVSTSFPVDVDFKIELLDSQKQVIGRSTENIKIPANAQMDNIQMIVKPENGSAIKGLDGITYTATVNQEAGNEGIPLTPEMSINLSDIRVKVNGAYIHKF